MSKGALRDFLLADPAIANRISDRIYNGRVPQTGTLPALVFRIINRDHDYSLANEIGMAEVIVQIDTYGDPSQGAKGAKDAEEIAELVRLRLSGYRGQLNDDVFCHGAFFGTDREDFDPPDDGSDNWTPRNSVDVSLHLTTAVPTH